MKRSTYIEIYNLIDDTMQAAGEKVEECCNKLAEIQPNAKSVLAEKLLNEIIKNQKKFNEMKDLLKRFENEVEEPNDKSKGRKVKKWKKYKY